MATLPGIARLPRESLMLGDLRTHRREFLCRAAVGLAAAGAALPCFTVAVAAEPEKSMDEIPIVDPHQHLWDLTKFRLPWTKDAPKLNRNFLISDYHQAAKGLGVVKTVYMEVDVDPAQQVAEAEYVSELCRD